jgi:holliday junction DNA helicase RuvB
VSEVEIGYRAARVLDVLHRKPELRDVLTDALLLHAQHADDPKWGFTRNEVRATWHQIQDLSRNRVIHVMYESRSRSEWALDDVDAVREGLRLHAEAADTAVEVAGRPPLPADLFEVVVGLERELELIRDALEAERPVHVLLEGPPAGAKSLILAELEALPGTRRVLAATSSRAGVVGYLLDQPDVWGLLVDEIEYMDPRELASVMRGLMEEGRVERLQHGHAEQERRDRWVIATCNHSGRLSAALLSRFHLRLKMPTYTDEQMRQVILQVLVTREGADPELAAEIAQAACWRTRDARSAVGIYRLCHGDRLRVPRLVQEVLPTR